MKKTLLYSAIPVLALATILSFNAGSASAAGCGCGCGIQNCQCQNSPGGQCQRGLGLKKLGMIELKAQTLGLSIDQLKEKLSQGKTYREIISETGMSFEQYRDKMFEALKAKLAK